MSIIQLIVSLVDQVPNLLQIPEQLLSLGTHFGGIEARWLLLLLHVLLEIAVGHLGLGLGVELRLRIALNVGLLTHLGSLLGLRIIRILLLVFGGSLLRQLHATALNFLEDLLEVGIDVLLAFEEVAPKLEEKEGFFLDVFLEVLLIENGENGLQKLDVVVLDVQKPVGIGGGVFNQLQQSELSLGVLFGRNLFFDKLCEVLGVFVGGVYELVQPLELPHIQRSSRRGHVVYQLVYIYSHLHFILHSG